MVGTAVNQDQRRRGRKSTRRRVSVSVSRQTSRIKRRAIKITDSIARANTEHLTSCLSCGTSFKSRNKTLFGGDIRSISAKYNLSSALCSKLVLPRRDRDMQSQQKPLEAVIARLARSGRQGHSQRHRFVSPQMRPALQRVA